MNSGTGWVTCGHICSGTAALFVWRRCSLGILALVFLASGFRTAFGTEATPLPTVQPPASSAYLLVMDHSGSMGTITPSGKTRWEEMQDRASKLVGRMPLESRVWMTVFADKVGKPAVFVLNTENDRGEALNVIRTGFGKPDGRTALFDALGAAFEEAERLSRDAPGRYITVLVYSDGLENNSEKWKEKGKLLAAFHNLVTYNEHFYVFYTQVAKPLPDETGTPLSDVLTPNEGVGQGEPNPQVFVKLWPSKVTLPKNPRIDPRPSVEIEFSYTDPVLDNQDLAISFQSSKNIAAEVVGGPYKLKRGKMAVQLEIANAAQLSATEEYLDAGFLRVTYPKISGYQVVPEGGIDAIAVSFPKEAVPPISDIRPLDGGVFPVDTEVVFSANTIQGADVLWDFGDGKSERGHVVRHKYSAAASPVVNLVVSTSPEIRVERTLKLTIVDVGVSLDPLRAYPIEGVPFKFTCTGRGPIESHEWFVDGGKYLGQGTRGAELTYSFDRPGTHLVSVVARSKLALVQSPEISVKVLPRPGLAIIEPQDKAKRYYGEKIVAKASVTGDVIEQVNWTILEVREGKEKILTTVDRRPVVSQVADMEYVLPLEAEPKTVIVRATGKLRGELQGVPPPSASISLALELPPTKLTILEAGPVQGEKIEFNKPAYFMASVEGPVEKVSWAVMVNGSPLPLEESHRVTPVLLDKDKRRLARFEFMFPESMGGPEADVIATGILPVAVAKPPSDVLKGVRPGEPMRIVRVTNPKAGDKVYFGIPLTLAAQVQAADVDKVVWVITDTATGKVLNAGGEKSVAAKSLPNSDLKMAEYSFTFSEPPDGRKALEVDIRAEGVPPPQAKTKPLDTLTHTVVHRPLGTVKIVAVGNYCFNTPIRFELDCQPEGAFADATWNFGDGSPEQATKGKDCVHTYSQYGDFKVAARVRGKGGDERVAEFTVPVRERAELKAIPCILVSGEAVKEVEDGTVVTLVDKSTGDVVKRIWTHRKPGGVEEDIVPEQQSSLKLEGVGDHWIKLRVEGPPNSAGVRPSNEKEVLIPGIKKKELWKFAIVGVVAIGFYGFLWRFFSGNAPRSWRVSGASLPDDSAFIVWRPVAKYWSRWSKVARIPLSTFFPTSAYWTKGSAAQDALIVGAIKIQGKIDGNLTPTCRGDRAVTWEEYKKTQERKYYHLLDGRAPEGEPFKEVYFCLDMKVNSSVTDLVVRAFAFVVLALVLGYAWHQLC